MRSGRLVALVLCGLVVGASAAAAQGETNSQERKGFWIGLGVGAGFLFDEDFANQETAPSGRFMIGGSLGQNVKIGYEGNSWVKSTSGVTQIVSMGGLTFHLYPWTTQGFYAIVGGGAAVLAVEGFDAEYGGSAFGGFGYDLRIGRTNSLTPYAMFNAGFFEGGQLYLVTVGLAFTFH